MSSSSDNRYPEGRSQSDSFPEGGAPPPPRVRSPSGRMFKPSVSEGVGNSLGSGEAQLPVLGPYRLLSELGRGAWGVVYHALHGRNEVALKVLRDAASMDGETVERFELEAAIMARIEHPGVVNVLDRGHFGPHLYYAMDFVAGETLAERLRRGPLSAQESKAVLHELAGMLAAVHAQGVVHRDIKPANLLFDKRRDNRLRLLDFGTALVATSQRDRLTATNTALGTPAYMAPEQFHSAKDVDLRADVYAMGAVLYTCLTGHPPFRAATALMLAEAVATQQPPPIRVAGVPRSLEQVCMRALAKDPADRFQSARGLRDALTAKPNRPSKVLLGGLSALALSCLTLVGALAWTGAFEVADEGEAAEREKAPVSSRDDTSVAPLPDLSAWRSALRAPGFRTELVAQAKRLIAGHPAQADALRFEAADYCRRRERFHQVVRLATPPSTAELGYLRMRALQFVGDMEGGLAARTDLLLSLKRGSTLARRLAGGVLLECSDSLRAVEVFESLLREEPDDLWHHIGFVRSCSGVGVPPRGPLRRRYDAALTRMKAATDDSHVLVTLGYLAGSGRGGLGGLKAPAVFEQLRTLCGREPARGAIARAWVEQHHHRVDEARAILDELPAEEAESPIALAVRLLTHPPEDPAWKPIALQLAERSPILLYKSLSGKGAEVLGEESLRPTPPIEWVEAVAPLAKLAKSPALPHARRALWWLYTGAAPAKRIVAALAAARQADPESSALCRVELDAYLGRDRFGLLEQAEGRAIRLGLDRRLVQFYAARRILRSGYVRRSREAFGALAEGGDEIARLAKAELAIIDVDARAALDVLGEPESLHGMALQALALTMAHQRKRCNEAAWRLLARAGSMDGRYLGIASTAFHDSKSHRFERPFEAGLRLCPVATTTVVAERVARLISEGQRGHLVFVRRRLFPSTRGVADNPNLWLLRGVYAEHEAEAREAFARALALDPKLRPNRPARQALAAIQGQAKADRLLKVFE